MNKFYILDFDRTLADSDKLLEVFIQVSEEYLAIPRSVIEAADADVKRRGDSFDTAGFVRDYLMEHEQLSQWDNLVKRFIHESRSLDMLMPGASELTELLESRDDRYGILTYGNPLWQGLKLSAAGFNHVPHIVTTSKRKGALISTWQSGDGSFAIPRELGGGVADLIVLIDDKAVSFADFPPLPSYGFHVLDLQNALPAQVGDVPVNVSVVKSLFDAVNSASNPSYSI